jgi:hypothetical protein
MIMQVLGDVSGSEDMWDDELSKLVFPKPLYLKA